MRAQKPAQTPAFKIGRRKQDIDGKIDALAALYVTAVREIERNGDRVSPAEGRSYLLAAVTNFVAGEGVTGPLQAIRAKRIYAATADALQERVARARISQPLDLI